MEKFKKGQNVSWYTKNIYHYGVVIKDQSNDNFLEVKVLYENGEPSNFFGIVQATKLKIE